MSSSSACFSALTACSSSSSSNNTPHSESSVSNDKLLETAEKTLKYVKELIKDGKLEEAQKLAISMKKCPNHWHPTSPEITILTLNRANLEYCTFSCKLSEYRNKAIIYSTRAFIEKDKSNSELYIRQTQLVFSEVQNHNEIFCCGWPGENSPKASECLTNCLKNSKFFHRG